MTLSIIVPIYKRAKELIKFLKKLEVQTDKNFELIMVVDTSTEDPLTTIDEYFANGKLSRENFKLIFNSKRVGRSKAIDYGIKAATGEYSIIMNPSDEFDKKLVAELKKIILEKDADIIEFKATVRSPIKFEGEIIKEFPTKINISENKNIFAYIYKFDFNKIFRTSVLQKAAEFKFSAIVNSRYSLEHAYKTLLVADTYATINQTFVTSVSEISDNFNPLKIIRQWKILQQFVFKMLDDKYSAEWKYAFARSQVTFMSKVVKTSKNKIIIEKYKQQLKEEFSSLNLQHNIYITHAIPQDSELQAVVRKIK